MATPLNQKSSIAEIRKRFDNDVDRFSNLHTGQSATIDAPLSMELITSAAVATTDPILRVLDIGCGAGNNTIKLRQELDNDFSVDLLDLSEPMLDRARERVTQVNRGKITTIASDFRDADLAEGAYDVIIAAAVLHHLRDDDDWRNTSQKPIVYYGQEVACGSLIWSLMKSLPCTR